MKNYKTEYYKKNNYFGLKNGQFLGACNSRKENYIFCIFSDGSSTVIVHDLTDLKHVYIFGGLEHCKHVFLNPDGTVKNPEYDKLTKEFIKALKAV